MLSFELAGGVDAVRQLVETLEVFTLAESLGGVESLIAHPATMTHAAMTPEARVVAGITDGLLRLSVGLEHRGRPDRRPGAGAGCAGDGAGGGGLIGAADSAKKGSWRVCNVCIVRVEGQRNSEC